MQKMTKKQIEDYEQLCRNRNTGRLLTPEGLRFICEANNFDPEAIGLHFFRDPGANKFRTLIVSTEVT